MTPHSRALATAPIFAPEHGQVVLEPEHGSAGHWVGCPSVLYEPALGRFLLTYRQRRPRGAAADRGWRCAIAQSTDGMTFSDVWAVEKHELGTSSMERAALLPDPAGGYLLYLSYVDPEDNRWRIDVLEADAPDAFSVAKAGAALTAAGTGTEGVKDPLALSVGTGVYLFASYAAAHGFSPEERRRAHAGADIYRSGMTTFPTGLAISQSGREFSWQPDALAVGSGWDGYQARLTTVLPTGQAFLGLYDGSTSPEENYEERTGVAVSFDLATWTRLTPDRPWLSSPHATGSLRYTDAVAVGDEWFVYYEYARADGAHELRLSRVGRAS